MEPIIIEHRGFIDKYIGDGIMALFSGSADDAVQAGINMIKRLSEYNQRRIKYSCSPIKIGIGINTGLLMLGTVGGHNRMDGTVISDAVNLASRIESLTKTYASSLLISHETFSHLENLNNYDIREMGSVLVKGKSQSVTVYEVFNGDTPSLREGKHKTRELFAKALIDYEARNFIAAAAGFAECIQQVPHDTASKLYFKRCQQFLDKSQSSIPN
jgi:class 3 adenylate cyclase